MVLLAIKGDPNGNPPMPPADGNVSEVARRLGGLGWETTKKYINKWASTALAFQLSKRALPDLAYSVVRRKVEQEDLSAAKYVLDNEGGYLGYGQKSSAIASASASVIVDNRAQRRKEIEAMSIAETEAALARLRRRIGRELGIEEAAEEPP